MVFKSNELKEAIDTPSSITHLEKKLFNVDELRNSLREFIFEKDKTLLDTYDVACFNRKISESGFDNLENLFNLLRVNFNERFKNDKERSAIIELMFNNIISSFKTLKIINTDFSSNEINTIILGFLIKNFI